MIDLPELVQLKILRYLDERSLNNATLLCRSMSNFIRNHRNTFVKRQILTLKISVTSETRNPSDSLEDMITCEVEICEFVGAGFESIGNQLDTKWVWGKQMPIWRGSFICFWEWIARKFMLTTIGTVFLRNVSFNEAQLDTIQRLFTNNKTFFEQVHLGNCLHDQESSAMMLRFLKMFGSTSLGVTDAPANICEFLGTRDVQEYLSTLQKLTSVNYPEKSVERETLDRDFCRYPPIFITQNGLITSTETLRKALQEWIRGALVLKRWILFLLPEDETYSRMAEMLGLPHERIGYDNGGDGYGEIVFTNVKGEKCLLRHECQGERRIAWSLTA